MKKLLALLLISSFVFQFCVASSVNAASPPFTAMGTVLDRHGQPVQGVTVTLINGVYQTLGTTLTDENGNFGFTNIVTSDPNVMVKLLYTANGKTYKTGITDSLWADSSAGIVEFDKRFTVLTDYPPPEYGYLLGTLQTSGNSPKALGNGVIYAVTAEQKYFVFTGNGGTSGQNKGTFLMHLPIGHYRVYAQYQDTGAIYQSSPVEVDVIGLTNPLDANSIQISMPMSAPSSNPDPAVIPGTYMNIVKGNVTTKEGKPLPDATVSLWQSADDGNSAPWKTAEAKTDGNGFYQFTDVKVTSDPPENSEIFGMKKFIVSTTYNDAEGTPHIVNKTFPLYNPDVIFGIGNMEQSARNMTADLQIDYARSGWVQILCDPQGAKVFVDNKPLIDPGTGKQYTAPCTAYIDPGPHIIKLSAPGYSDKTTPVVMKENMQTETVVVHLDSPVVPAWITLAVVVIILLVVAIIILALLASKRHLFMGPLAGILAPLKRSVGNFRASSESRKVHRAHAAELKKSEQAHRAMVKEPHAAVKQPKLEPRKRDQELAFNAQNERPRLPEYRGEDEVERPSMVSAREIYRKKEQPEVERVTHSQMSGPVAKAPPIGYDQPPEHDGRIRLPKATPAMGQTGSTLRDKERVIRYIRDHPDGVSFIQMSNELEIPPNTLTIITKELVINDDIEKIKGLYYYKSHDSSGDESKSSVVVWRLDGDE